MRTIYGCLLFPVSKPRPLAVHNDEVPLKPIGFADRENDGRAFAEAASNSCLFSLPLGGPRFSQHHLSHGQMRCGA